MKPTVGRIVNFYPSDIDNEAKDNGAEVLPAVIVRVWSEETVNLKVLTDSDKGELWRTSVTKRPEGTVSPQNATWDWPVKIVMDKRTAFKLAKEEVASHSIYKRWENIEAELKGTEEYIDFLEIAAELYARSKTEQVLFNYRNRLLEAQLMNDGILTITDITTCFAQTKEQFGLTEESDG